MAWYKPDWIHSLTCMMVELSPPGFLWYTSQLTEKYIGNCIGPTHYTARSLHVTLTVQHYMHIVVYIVAHTNRDLTLIASQIKGSGLGVQQQLGVRNQELVVACDIAVWPIEHNHTVHIQRDIYIYAVIMDRELTVTWLCQAAKCPILGRP